MKPLFRISAGLILGLSFITSAAANDHKILGVVAMPRNETNDLTLKLPAGIKEGSTSGWININSDNDSKRCVKKIAFSGHTVHSSDMASLKIIGDD